MRADEMLKKYGKNLVGKEVLTEAMGKYPGGIAKVVDIEPDIDSGISFIVNNKNWLGVDDTGNIGIFEYEEVVLL